MAPFTEACTFNHTLQSIVGRAKLNQNNFLPVLSAASETNEGVRNRATEVTEAQ